MKNHTLLILFLIPFSAFCQNSKVDSLISQRHILYERWLDDETKRSGFFGNQTKTDLKGMIETLKGITNKDNEIIAAVEEKYKLEQASLRSENGKLNYHVTDANIEMGKLDDRIKSLESQLQKATDELIPLKSYKSRGNTITILLGLLLLVSAILNLHFSLKNKKKLM